jgi:dihydroorotase
MLILTGGRVIDPLSDLDAVSDVVIDGGRIVAIGNDAGAAHRERAERVVDCAGKIVAPGFVDIHVHLREPGHEYKEDIASGLAAAAAGGFTAVCAMPNTKPVNDERAITRAMIERARDVGGARFFPIAAITRGLEGKELTEMAELKAAGAVAVSDDGKCVMNAQVMRRAFEYARGQDLLVIQHCEDHHMTAGTHMHEGPNATKLGLRGFPREAEDIIVARDIILAELTGARYHVAHISSQRSVRLVREAKARGLPVTAEVTPHHLLLTDDALLGYDTHCKCNPPLREESDRRALVEALADGTIDCIATDHAPHSTLEKDCEFDRAAVGVNGLETAFPALLSLVDKGEIDLRRLIESLTVSPARVLPEVGGGTLGVGAPADVVVLDPERRWTVRREALRSRSHNTPLLDIEVKGAVEMTLVDGNVAYERET